MVLDNYDSKQKQTLKRFGIISGIIFIIIVVLAIFHVNYSSNNSFIQSLHIITLTAGIIGLGYCVIILKSFDTKIDPSLQYKYNQMTRDLENNENKNKK